MSGTTDLGRALHAWRDRTKPAEVGLPDGGGRRAPGLRREELAQLAGLSVDYIVRLEQGRSTNPSPQVLSALARALRLATAEREHLFVLAGQTAPSAGQVSDHVPAGVQRLLDRLTGTPLSVYDAAWTSSRGTRCGRRCSVTRHRHAASGGMRCGGPSSHRPPDTPRR